MKSFVFFFIVFITVTLGFGQIAPIHQSQGVKYGQTLKLLNPQIDSIAPDTSGMGNLSSVELSNKLGRGWNLGNTLEAIGGETAWGNPKTTQRLIDSVKAAGFNSIRIPVAWSVFSDESTYTIDSAWMARVEEVVKYALNDSMYVLLNEHWDGGWLQPTYAEQEISNERLAAIWQQIAIHFRDYDEHLIFAGTNEVMVDGDYGEPTEEYYTVQNGFNQLFVNTIRSTGGRNVYRYLAVQGFNTNINYTVKYFTLPQDVISNRLMLEVHYYDPYNFTINANSSLYVWGKDAPKSETWANETYADAQFQKLKTNFIDKNCAVLIGEYCASARLNLGSSDLNATHAMYRQYYMKYITHSIVSHGLIPFYWDSGYLGNNASGLFNRTSGAQAYPNIIEAIIDTSNVQSPVVTSIHDITTDEFKLYPNPANMSINLEWANEYNNTIELYNTYGQLMEVFDVIQGNNTYDICKLTPGLYFMKVPSSIGFITYKVLKE